MSFRRAVKLACGFAGGSAGVFACAYLADKHQENSLEVENNKPTATRHIFLIRHSQYNLNGSRDPERTLTPLGREQAVLTGQRLASLGLKYDILVHSSMARATETAQIISTHLPGNTHTHPHQSSSHTPGSKAFLLLCQALQFPPEGWLRLGLNNGSITWLTVRPSGRVALRALGDSGFMPPDKVTRT
ncbi:Serine/threonine-protein phosphatase PGAM5, mitochondrial [Bagarius yarrelli]|uniref:Serine/threonine-protein phosphatase PGAM5, mitochondrial n=1 Tax=Bagarius yarrelli TaxID=175774 RepID=A0A556UFW2_BAGYA|nr:Serine/threonine-protein phosphatase PGAM5, mitochondrial [Bagarius yarrelli]